MKAAAATHIGEAPMPPFAIMPMGSQPHAMGRKSASTGQIVVLRPSEDLLSGGNVPRLEAVALPYQSEMEQLAERGVRESWHLSFMKTPYTPQSWKAKFGESFEASMARRQFQKVMEAYESRNGESVRRETLLARRAGSAAGVRTEEALANKLKIDPAVWERITGAPFEPLKGHWETIGRYETQEGKIRPIRSFRLDQPVVFAPNCALG